MAGDALEAPVIDEETLSPRKKSHFPAWMRLGATLRRGSSDPGR